MVFIKSMISTLILSYQQFNKLKPLVVNIKQMMFFFTSNRLDIFLMTQFSPENVKLVGGGYLPKVSYKKIPVLAASAARLPHNRR